MSDEAQRWGRIGGLTAQARHGAEKMTAPARQGFARRFEQLVDPDGVLDPAERAVRAERARRAHMLVLAERSAAVRRARAQARQMNVNEAVGPGANGLAVPAPSPRKLREGATRAR